MIRTIIGMLLMPITFVVIGFVMLPPAVLLGIVAAFESGREWADQIVDSCKGERT